MSRLPVFCRLANEQETTTSVETEFRKSAALEKDIDQVQKTADSSLWSRPALSETLESELACSSMMPVQTSESGTHFSYVS
jgi:hypothetical protein